LQPLLPLLVPSARKSELLHVKHPDITLQVTVGYVVLPFRTSVLTEPFGAFQKLFGQYCTTTLNTFRPVVTNLQYASRFIICSCSLSQQVAEAICKQISVNTTCITVNPNQKIHFSLFIVNTLIQYIYIYILIYS
jgi:hypothetical protein